MLLMTPGLAVVVQDQQAYRVMKAAGTLLSPEKAGDGKIVGATVEEVRCFRPGDTGHEAL
ncbi:MAG: hypothetical protein ACLP5H_29645 [Desulfomonilaceae bacterium]